jgi:hypothetical protein
MVADAHLQGDAICRFLHVDDQDAPCLWMFAAAATAHGGAFPILRGYRPTAAESASLQRAASAALSAYASGLSWIRPAGSPRLESLFLVDLDRDGRHEFIAMVKIPLAPFRNPSPDDQGRILVVTRGGNPTDVVLTRAVAHFPGAEVRENFGLAGILNVNGDGRAELVISYVADEVVQCEISAIRAGRYQNVFSGAAY